MGVIAAIEFEWGVIGAGIFGIVIRKLSYWQLPCPIILFEINKGSKLGLHYTILPLVLTVSLRIDDSIEALLDAEEIAEGRPELQGEN